MEGGPGRGTTVEMEMQTPREMDQAEVGGGGGWQCQHVTGSSSFWGILQLLSHPSPSQWQVALYPGRSFLWDRILALIQSSKRLGTILCLILGVEPLLSRLASLKWSSITLNKKTSKIIMGYLLYHHDTCSDDCSPLWAIPSLFTPLLRTELRPNHPSHFPHVPSHPWHWLPNIVHKSLPFPSIISTGLSGIWKYKQRPV